MTNLIFMLFAFTIISGIYMYFVVRYCVKKKCIKPDPWNAGLVWIPGVNSAAAVLFTALLLISFVDNMLIGEEDD